MNLYLIYQTQNKGWDTYDSAVVCAPDEETARHINLNGSDESAFHGCWCSGPEYVHVVRIGVADSDVKPGVVCASFNAG